jgi:hypothetical protein
MLSRRAGAAICAAVVGCSLVGAAGASAATTYTVTSFSDGASSACSSGDVCPNLRSAVAAAVAADAPATVSLSAGTYTLTSDELSVDSAYSGAGDAVTITGAGPGETVIDQTDAGKRVLDFTSGGPYLVSDLEVTGGNATGSSANGAEGGGIDGDLSVVNLTDVLITGNSVVGATGGTGGSGGNGGTGGAAAGGGFYDVSGTGGTISDSTIAGNTVTGGTGGLPGTGGGTTGGSGGSADGGGLTVSNATILDSTLSGNTSTGGAGGSASTTGDFPGPGNIGYGGGLAGYPLADVYLVNSTVSGNTAGPGPGGAGPPATSAGTVGAAQGGGIGALEANGSFVFSSDTISSNSALGVNGAGGNMYLTGQSTGVWVKTGTIFSGGSADTDADCNVVKDMGFVEFDYRYNAESDASGQCDLSAGENDLLGVSLELGALAANGGPTETQLPLAGSPLIGADSTCTYSTGGAFLALTTDQRGEARSGACDIGAVQLQPAAAVGAPSITGTAAIGGTLICSATGVFSGDELTYTYAWLRDGSAIAGQTVPSYTVAGADGGHSLACEVTATGAAGAAVSVNSAAKPIAAPAAAPVPVSRRSTLSWVKVASLKAKGREIKLTFRCSGGTTSCSGKLLITAKLHGKKASTLASVRYTVAAATRKTITIKITGTAVKWLKAHKHKLTVKLKVTPAGGKGVSHKLRITGN